MDHRLQVHSWLPIWILPSSSSSYASASSLFSSSTSPSWYLLLISLVEVNQANIAWFTSTRDHVSLTYGTCCNRRARYPYQKGGHHKWRRYAQWLFYNPWGYNLWNHPWGNQDCLWKSIFDQYEKLPPGKNSTQKSTSHPRWIVGHWTK